MMKHVLALSLFCMAAHAGTIQMGTPTVNSGVYDIPITLSGGSDQVSAMDFRISYDPAVFRPVAIAPGPMALQANKQVIGNGPTPGEYVVIMHGINQNTVGNGKVASVQFERIDGSDSASRLDILEPTLASIEGDELPVSSSGRTIGREAETGPDGNSGGNGGDLPATEGTRPAENSQDTPGEPATPVTPDAPAAPSSPQIGDFAGGGFGMSPNVAPVGGSGGLVIPRPIRPEAPGTDAGRAVEAGAQPDRIEQPNSSASKARENVLPAPGQSSVNTKNHTNSEMLAESDQDDVRIQLARVDPGVTPIESDNGSADAPGISASPDDAGRDVSRLLIAVVAFSILIVATAMMALRHRLFR